MKKSTPITRTEITDLQSRLNMLPKHFGRQMMRFESAVYYFASRLCEEYKGGFWNYYELSNGGFYMSPVIDGSLHVQWYENGYDGRMNADAFGITACLFALSHLSFQVKEADEITAHYHHLLDYADIHAESKEIFNAID